MPKPFHFIFVLSCWCGDCYCKKKNKNNSNIENDNGISINENIDAKIQTIEIKEIRQNKAGIISQNLSYLNNASSILIQMKET